MSRCTKRLKCIQEHKTKEFSSVYRHSSITAHKFNFDSPFILSADTKESYSARQSLNANIPCIQSLECKLW